MGLDLDAARRHAESAASEVAHDLREGFGAATARSFKSERATDVVTAYDVETDERLVKLLGSFDTGIGYLGEEVGHTGSTSTYWAVDPIDGTGHFLRGSPLCSTMIALIHEGVVVVGVIHDFVAGRAYSAARGAGATCNGEPISVSPRGLRDGYVGGSVPAQSDDDVALLRALQGRTTLLRTSSSGWDLSMTASGRLEGVIVRAATGKLWDYAAGSLLVEEAGGRVANLGSHDYDVTAYDFAAGTPAMMAELMDTPDALFPR